MTNDELQTTEYRGYTIVTNDLGSDVWIQSLYLSTEHGPMSLDKAKRVIDEWHNAP